MRLRDLGENGLIDRIRQRFRTSTLPVGIGDDAAIIDVPAGHSLVYCSDLVVENTHFLRAIHPAHSIGYKAVAVNVSDVGAMGGIPMAFTISLAAPAALEVSWIDELYSGVEKACRDFDIALAGGDSSTAQAIFVDVSMIGRVRANAAVRRSTAQPGDSIYVTGKLGGSLLGLKDLQAGKRDTPAIERHLYPAPRHRAGYALAGTAHAMIDISDGLSTDLMHVLKESSVSARLYKDRLPVFDGANHEEALHGGEEYELLITAPDLPVEIEGAPLSRVGEIVPEVNESQIVLIDGSAESVLIPRGWEHYR